MESYNGHEYQAVECSTRASCVNLADQAGAYLVTIGDEQEQKWLVNTFGSDKYFWIGLSDEETEGVWKWTSGEILSSSSYKNWAKGEPNDTMNEDYAVMNWGGMGTWNGVSETSHSNVTVRHAIVERPAP